MFLLRCTRQQLVYSSKSYRSRFLTNYGRYDLLRDNTQRTNCSKRFISISSTTFSVLTSKEQQTHDVVLGPIHKRYISFSHPRFDKVPLKTSSKVEETVNVLKAKQEEESKTEVVPVKPAAKSMYQKVKDELVHYYHGFRLLFIDVKISSGLVRRVLQGKNLTRREYNLLKRTVGDLFRLVPFSVFIIVPFMEFLLPFFIKFFPGMLPSTFQTTKERDDKIKQNLKVKLEMAKFLQGTLDEMAVHSKDHHSSEANLFQEWFVKVRNTGENVSSEEIMKYSKLFEDEITLDSLSRSQLIALCRVLEVQTLGTNYFLRFQLRMKLRSLAADDKMIQKEGVESLTLNEVQQACRARGLRAYGVSEERLRKQLNNWLDLSLNHRVPPSLLLLSTALMLPETIPTSDKLKATISVLPDTVIKHTQAAIGEKEGKIDNRVKIAVLKEEEKKIKEERKEQQEEKKKMEKELLIDKAPVISVASTPALEEASSKISIAKLEAVEKKEDHLQSKDIEILESAIDSVSKEKKLIVEKGEIEELKAEMADYKEDVADLEKVVATQEKPEVKESKAAQRLYKSVDSMIKRMDKALVNLEKKEKQLKQSLAEEENETKKEELLKIDEIIMAMKKIQEVSPDRINQITKVLNKMDDDHDGSLKVDDVLKVIEMIGKENVKLTDKQIDEVIALLDKEEILEVEDKIEKALQKEKDDPSPPKVKGRSSQPDTDSTVKEKKLDKTKSDSNNVTSPASTIIPPPPVSSIDKAEPKNSSKSL